MLASAGWIKDTDEKSKDESGENGKDGPNTESIGDGCDPRIGIIVPEVVDVQVPERGWHDDLFTDEESNTSSTKPKTVSSHVAGFTGVNKLSRRARLTIL